jgi:hypothetical protein
MSLELVILKLILSFCAGWITAGSIALFAFMRCQYCDQKLVDPRANVWTFLGIDDSATAFWVGILLVLEIIWWPDLFQEKKDYELGYPDDNCSELGLAEEI